MEKCKVVIHSKQCDKDVYKNGVCKAHYKEINSFVEMINKEIKGADFDFKNAFTDALNASLEKQLENKLQLEKYKKH